MIQEYLCQLLREAVSAAAETGALPAAEVGVIELERPRERSHGDWATNLALTLAGALDMAPRRVAEAIIAHAHPDPAQVSGIEVAGPGFINFRLASQWLHRIPIEIERSGDSYGHSDLGGGRRVQVEFVSANPVGPMHIGHGRWAAVGDVLASCLAATGHQVEREFYINDYGSQMEVFGRSVAARYLELVGEPADFPEDGYQGEYIRDIAREIVEREGDRYLAMPPEERETTFRERAYVEVLDHLKKTLADMGVTFDVWFSERSLYAGGAVEETVEELRRRGHVYERDGAVWLRTTEFGDDKDRVLIREGGLPTYFCADIAYHRDKLTRGFQTIINIWGADHHGYVKRMQAALRALGHDEDVLEVIIGQLVNLFRAGEPVRMSKRTGEMVTLEELLDEVGRDAARYFFLMRSTDTSLDFDIELAKKQTQDNPVFYVQYAHARISSILTHAAERGVEPVPAAEADLGLLSEEGDLALLRKLAEWPEILARAAESRAPYTIAKYAEELAGDFHVFYTKCRVVTDDPELSRARLTLVRAAQLLLKQVLGLAGVRAPDSM